MKRFLISSGIVLVSIFGLGGVLSFAAPTTVNAVDCSGKTSSFLSFPTWYRGLEGKDNGKGGCDFGDLKGKNLGSTIFTIILNVIDMALRVVAILAIGFIIFGGFLYLTSQGEPERTKKGTDTLLKAVIGLVIAILSTAVVSFIVARLAKS
jgi:hypothetical protein